MAAIGPTGPRQHNGSPRLIKMSQESSTEMSSSLSSTATQPLLAALPPPPCYGERCSRGVLSR